MLIDEMNISKFRTIPKMYENLYKKILKGEHNRPQAVKCFCMECCGFSRSEVKECISNVCPLWKFRPFQKTKNKVLENDEKVLEEILKDEDEKKDIEETDDTLG